MIGGVVVIQFFLAELCLCLPGQDLASFLEPSALKC